MDYPKSVPGVSLLNGQFTDGNPLLGIPASLDPAKWANDVTEELLNVIRAAGLIPAEGDSAQLLAAINAIVTASLAPAATTDVAGVVELATAQELAAGTAGGLAVTPGILKPVLDGKQAAAANLSALAGLAGAADRLPYFTGAGALSLATLTAAARTLLAATDAAGQRTAMGLGDAAVSTIAGQFDGTPGRLMAVGYLGLGSTDLVDEAADASVINMTGFHFAGSAGPGGAAGQMIALTNSQNYTWQIGCPLGQQDVYTRNSTAGVYPATWAKLFSTANVSAFIQTLFDDADAAAAQATLNGFGYNQTWQDVTASRALGTTYTNTAGRPIQVFVDLDDSGAQVGITFNINGISWATIDPGSQSIILPSFVVPPGNTYSITGGSTLRKWLELR